MNSIGSLRQRVLDNSKQFDLFGFPELSPALRTELLHNIRLAYWLILHSRRGAFGQAMRRRQYRIVARHKKSLLGAGYPKSDILRFLACLRGRVPCGHCIGCAS